MDMSGERRIPAPREKVWAALNDPEILRSSIPGCETMEKLSDNELKATAAVRIGPISARFTGKVQLLDLDPPNGYRIAGEGQGGVAGFAKGGATVKLTQDGSDTIMAYDVKAQVGGKIAQLGARLIDATAKQMADAFFDRFAATVGAVEPAPVPMSVAGDAPVAPPPRVAPPPAPSISLFAMLPKEPGGFPLVAWIGTVIFLFIAFMLLKGFFA
jgi:carbon monoxide dehydrogenase subunit G